MYVSCDIFKDGVWLKGHPLFYTNQAWAVFDRTVAKFTADGTEAIVTIRNNDHSLVKAWGSVKEPLALRYRIKAVRKGITLFPPAQGA